MRVPYIAMHILFLVLCTVRAAQIAELNFLAVFYAVLAVAHAGMILAWSRAP